MNYLIVALFGFLVGCKSPTPLPPVRVEVPVISPCIASAPVKPVLTINSDLINLADKCAAGDDLACYAYTTDLHADRLRLEAWKLQADAAIQGCVAQ